MAWDGSKWGREVFFPTNPDLADILGDTDFDFDNFIFLGSQISGLGPAWAQLGPTHLGRVWVESGPGHLTSKMQVYKDSTCG